MNTFLVDRIQTAGANLNIPTEKIHELGNYQSVAVIRDVPDLTFTLDTLSVDTEVEALVCDPGYDGTVSPGDKFSLVNNFPADIVSPWKTQGEFEVVKGVAVPQLTLESVSYRYGLRENAGEQYSLRGDSIFYVPGTPYVDTAEGDGTQTLFEFEHGPALVYTEQGESLYALNVSVDGVRMFGGEDYEDTAAGVTFAVAPADGARVRIVYGSATPATYGQDVHSPVSGTPTPPAAIKPAAIRGKDIQVYIGLEGGNPYRWSDVQSVNVDWRVTLEDDFEFGNPRAVARDATDAPEVTGAIELKPLSPERFFDKLRRITGLGPDDVVGPQSSVPVAVEIVLLNPDSGGADDVPAGTEVKTLYVPDARFTIPSYEGRVQQKLQPTLNFESDGGILEVFNRARPA